MFFDKNEDIDISLTGDLPHRHQAYKYQFVTFRLADSLPKSKTSELHDNICAFKEKYPKP